MRVAKKMVSRVVVMPDNQQRQPVPVLALEEKESVAARLELDFNSDPVPSRLMRTLTKSLYMPRWLDIGK